MKDFKLYLVTTSEISYNYYKSLVYATSEKEAKQIIEQKLKDEGSYGLITRSVNLKIEATQLSLEPKVLMSNGNSRVNFDLVAYGNGW